ncbi:aerobic-type carbon monoxide dehydrogenase, middle subunit CoxM/CutM-like protein [Puniceibacterium sp. IMCC21224]|nr:aerobic-type carbon monoxide dehydrogenase, middle subunit CoxM/CutM-like protein [Puniceibacterium sp. IMCC21224]
MGARDFYSYTNEITQTQRTVSGEPRKYTKKRGMMAYHAPTDLNVALDTLAGGSVSIVAGATDWFPSRGDRAATGDILDITRLAGLSGVSKIDGGWIIGATARWSDILRAELPSFFGGLRAAAREVGSIQIQNAGTVVGNICNASPAADGVPPLLTLDAQVRIASKNGVRSLPLHDFLKGVRQTALQPGELVTGVFVPDQPTSARGAFLKLGSRKYLVISIAMVAAIVEMREGRIASARIAVGACSAVAQRLYALEAALTGAAADDFAARIQPAHLASLAPITDMRGTAEYRLSTISELCVRAVHLAIKENADG